MDNKPSYEELEKRLNRLEVQHNQTKHVFAGFSHDFNNLITHLLGYTGLLLSEIKDESGNLKEYSDNIHDSSKRLVELVKKMGNFSKSDTPIYLVKDFLEDLVKGVKNSNIGKNTNISYDSSSDSTSIQVDKTKLYDALFSLCVYSIHSLPPQGEIKLRSELVDGSKISFPDFKKIPYVLIELEDNGPNIPEYILPVIFEPFAKIDRIPSDDSEGSRLALSTCKSIIENNMGHIFVESEKGKNTKFVIYLPEHNPE